MMRFDCVPTMLFFTYITNAEDVYLCHVHRVCGSADGVGAAQQWWRGGDSGGVPLHFCGGPGR